MGKSTKVAVTNDETFPVQIAGRMVLPGQTIYVPWDQLPPEWRSPEPPLGDDDPESYILPDHTLASHSDVADTAPASGEVLKWNGTQWAPAADSGGVGGAVTSVAGKTGAVSLVVGDVSGAEASGAGASAVAAHAALANAHGIAGVNGLQTALDAKAATTHNHSGVYEPVGTAASQVSSHAASADAHAISAVTGLQTALDAKSATNHNHAGVYEPAGTAAGQVATHAATANAHAISGVTGLQTALDAKSATTHNHAGVYEPAGAVVSAITAHEADFDVHVIGAVSGLQAALDAKAGTALATGSAPGLMPSASFTKLADLDYQPGLYSILWAQLGQPATQDLDGVTLDADVQNFAVELSGDLSQVVEVDYLLNGPRYASSVVSPFRTVVEASELQDTNAITARVHFTRGYINLAVAAFSRAVAPPQKFLKTPDPNPIILEVPVGGSIAARTLTVETSDGESATLVVTDDQTWLDSSISGSVLTIADNGISALAEGEYTSTVVVTATNYDSLVVTVTIRVQAVAYTIQYADNTAFSNALPINGAVVSGLKTIGLTPLTSIASVAWYMDDVLFINRTASPYDFGADASATAAALWDSSAVDSATHSIKAIITRTGASSVNQILNSASFGSGTGWTGFNVDDVPGSTIAGPEPGQVLSLLQAQTNVTSAQHTWARSINKTPGAVSATVFMRLTIKPDPANPHYTFLLYIAQSSTTMSNSTQFARVYFRLDSGNVSTYNPGTANSTDGWSVVSHGVTANADGSFWVDLKVTTNATAELYTRLVFTDPAFPTSSGYINSVLTGAYVSFQMAYGDTMTPYVATTTTEVVTSGQPPVTVESSFTVQNAPKVLTASPSPLVFSATAGGSNPTAQNLSILSSAGTAAVTFSLVGTAPWLTAPTGGNAVLGTPLVKSIAPSITGLAAGTYSVVLRASATGYASVDIPVQFNVNAAAATYALYTSPNGVGVAPVTALQGATTALEPYIWLASTATPNTAVVLAGADTFSFWNTATLDSEESTKPPVRTIVAPNPAYPAGSFTQFTGRMVEFVAEPKNYHWRLIKNGVTSRGNTSYTYGTAAKHTDAKCLALRMDRYEGKGPGQVDGQHFFSTAETAYLANSEVGVIGVMLGWNKVERTAGSGTTSGPFVWAQVDHMLAVAKSLNKKLVICLSPKKWAGNPPPDLASNPALWNFGTGTDARVSDFTGLANWNNATMRTRFKNIIRAFLLRYNADDAMLGLWTDETSQGSGNTGGTGIAAGQTYNSVSGSNENSRAAGWYQLHREMLQEKIMSNTHYFIGATAFNIANAPGGNFDILANLGAGIAWPDHLYSSATIDRGQKLMYSYKGRVAGYAWGDSYQNAGSEGYPDTDRPRLILRQNLDYTIPTPLGPANYGTPVSEAGCTRAQIIGFMPVATSVRRPPIQARWSSDVANAVAFIRANPQYFAGIPTASNLVNKV